MEIVKVDIVFRVDTSKNFKGTVFALFPHECDDRNGNVTRYQHVGQHSSADYHHCIATSRLAKPEEYAPLMAEMKSLGYDINVVKKQNYDKYLESYYALRKNLG